MPSNARSRMRYAPLLAGLLAMLAVGPWSCNNSSDDGPQCPEGQEYTTFQGQSACRNACVTDDTCALGRRCFDGVCVPKSTTSDADAATDSDLDAGPSVDIDTGRCSPDSRLTIYRGVTKCRPFCDSDDDCEGALACEDGHCIDRSLDSGIADTFDGGDTSDARDTTDDADMSGGLSCSQISRCLQTCTLGTCEQNVFDAASSEGSQNYNNLVNCVQTNCPQQDQRCIDRNCATENTACFPRVTGEQNLSCSKLFRCLGDCGQDQMCRDDCIARSQSQAQNQYDTIVQCIEGECPNFRDSCVDGAISGACTPQWRTCFGCPQQ